jgi:hypothetical protein
MSDESKFMDELRRASIDTTVQQLRVMNELKASAPSSVPPGMRRKSGRESAPGDYMLGLARLMLNNYNELLRFHSGQFDYIAGRLRELGELYWPRDDEGVSEAALHLKGPVGGDASKGFVLENLHATATEVSFSTSEFSPAGGGPRFGAGVTVAPRDPASAEGADAGRTVASGTRRTFNLRVRLDAAVFQPGERYRAETHVLVNGKIAGRLALELQVGVASAVRPRATPARRGRPTRGK